MVNALESLLASARRFVTSWTNVQCIRLFIILFEVTSTHGRYQQLVSIIRRCFKSRTHSHSSLYSSYKSWQKLTRTSNPLLVNVIFFHPPKFCNGHLRFTHQKFHSLLSLLHQAITFRILLPPFVESVNTDKVIITATKAMSLLYQVNEKVFFAKSRDLIDLGKIIAVY